VAEVHITPERITVSVSIAPFRFFVDEIGGRHFDVNVMVPPGPILTFMNLFRIRSGNSGSQKLI
jgi:hypothetical protein